MTIQQGVSVVVPVEATEEMLNAGLRQWIDQKEMDVAAIWSAMVSASPAGSGQGSSAAGAADKAWEALRFVAGTEANNDRLASVFIANWVIQDLAALSRQGSSDLKGPDTHRATDGAGVGPDCMSAEGKFFVAVDHLTRMTWRWGESCGIDNVSWDEKGDSYNEGCRDDHLKARRAVTEAFHAAVAEKSAAPAPVGWRLHPATDDLVDRFAGALKEKLAKAEAKYGYTAEWARSDWQADLIWHLGNHVQKGDPRDVAAYCAFAWHHGWSIAPPNSEARALADALVQQLAPDQGEAGSTAFGLALRLQTTLPPAPDTASKAGEGEG